MHYPTTLESPGRGEVRSLPNSASTGEMAVRSVVSLLGCVFIHDQRVVALDRQVIVYPTMDHRI